MILNAITVLLPIFFVLGLGYVAGRTRKFDADQVQGINHLVMNYAMPAMMFVATASTKRSELLTEGAFLLALLGAFAGLFGLMFVFSKRVLRHSIGEAALQANLASYPSVAFIGVPLFRGLFGGDSLVAIATAAVLSAVTIVPLTMILMEIHAGRAKGESEQTSGSVIVSSLRRTFRQPMVFMPLIGVALALAGIPVPQVVDNMLVLIGSTTSGVSIFLAGLILSAYTIKLNAEVIGTAVVKLVGQPVLMALLVAALGVSNPLGREGIVICTIPSSVVASLIAPRYKVYEVESASTLILTTLGMIVTMPLAIVLIGV